MQIELWPIGVAQCLRSTMTSISKWEVPLCSNWIPLHWRIHRQFKQFDPTSESTCHYCCSINATASLLFLQFSSLGPQGLLVQVVSVPKIENSFFFSSVLPPPLLPKAKQHTPLKDIVVMDRAVRDMMDMGMEDMTMVFHTQFADLFCPIWSSFIAVLTTVIKSGVSFQRSILCSFMIARRQMWFLLIFFFPLPVPISLSLSCRGQSFYLERLNLRHMLDHISSLEECSKVVPACFHIITNVTISIRWSGWMNGEDLFTSGRVSVG